MPGCEAGHSRSWNVSGTHVIERREGHRRKPGDGGSFGNCKLVIISDGFSGCIFEHYFPEN